MLFKPDRREPLSSINLTSPGSLFSVDTEKSTLKVFFNQLNFRYMETFRAFGFHFVMEQTDPESSVPAQKKLVSGLSSSVTNECSAAIFKITFEENT